MKWMLSSTKFMPRWNMPTISRLHLTIPSAIFSVSTCSLAASSGNAQALEMAVKVAALLQLFHSAAKFHCCAKVPTAVMLTTLCTNNSCCACSYCLTSLWPHIIYVAHSWYMSASSALWDHSCRQKGVLNLEQRKTTTADYACSH